MTLSDPEPTASAKIVIIGGGVIGLSVAYHLAKLGVNDVLLVERNQLTSGTSWHAAGIVGPLRASLNATKLACYATELFPSLEKETGQSTGYRRTGGFWLAREPARLIELRRIEAIGEMAGVDARIVSPDDVQARVPNLYVDDLLGALFVGTDGQANPVDVCMAYAKGARARGVRIYEGVRCVGFETAHGAVRAVRLSDGVTVRCDAVVNCAGAWARNIGALAGVPVPLQAVEHMYVVTQAVPDLSLPFPIIRDVDAGIYIKEDAGKLVLGGFEPKAKCWHSDGSNGDRAFLELPEDWEQFEPFMRAGLERVPALEQLGIAHFMNGPESFTPDTRPLLGESPYLDNFFVAAGFNSTGMMSSAGAGQAMAQWIVDREAPMDLWDVDISRFDAAFNARTYLEARIEEAVGEVFQIHWPYHQSSAGRDLRQTPLHAQLRTNGAVFGALAGWERPLWYARDPNERELRYSYESQPWWPAAEREALAARDGVVFVDLSPFTKIDVSGRDALRLLQFACVSNVDSQIGQSCYTQMLNSRGGIEADVTVTRFDENLWRVVGGAPTRYKDFAWLRRLAASQRFDVSITDRTDDEAVLGVFGPHARALLQIVSSNDLSNSAWPLGTSGNAELGGSTIRLNRMSFIGELGFEIYVDRLRAALVLRLILEAGQAFGLLPFGHWALDACRVEKGYLHWGHDIGPWDSPIEAGLSFTVAWDKPGAFLGYDSLSALREAGATRRLVQFVLSDRDDGQTNRGVESPLLLHDEPIFRDGVRVGHTTSGARGFRTGRSICLGYVSCSAGASLRSLADGEYEVAIADTRYPLVAQSRAFYDPDGRRMNEHSTQ